MGRYAILGGLVTCLFLLTAAPGANALVPTQTNIATAAFNTSSAIEVKRTRSARPPGWDRGRKVGWRGARKPPGQRR